jgi:16S rRNA (cytidine1402-2'-O)-methyltransferase
LAAEFAAEDPPKGEIVVVIGPPLEAAASAEDADRVLLSLLETQPVSAAVAEAVAVTGLKRRDLYRRALELKEGKDAGAA